MVSVPVLKRNLRRVKDTPTQTKLDAEARMKNLRDAFAVRDETVFKNKRLVILDDVFTTGATMDSCARTLRAAGARDVIALAVARGVEITTQISASQHALPKQTGATEAGCDKVLRSETKSNS